MDIINTFKLCMNASDKINAFRINFTYVSCFSFYTKNSPHLPCSISFREHLQYPSGPSYVFIFYSNAIQRNWLGIWKNCYKVRWKCFIELPVAKVKILLTRVKIAVVTRSLRFPMKTATLHATQNWVREVSILLSNI